MMVTQNSGCASFGHPAWKQNSLFFFPEQIELELPELESPWYSESVFIKLAVFENKALNYKGTHALSKISVDIDLVDTGL